MPQLSLKNRSRQFTLIVAAMFLCGYLLNSGRVYVSRHCQFVFDFKLALVGASNRSVAIAKWLRNLLQLINRERGLRRVTYILINVSVNASYSVKSCPRGLLRNHFRSQ